MAMPAVPGAGLAVIEAEIVLRPLEALLDGPSQAGGAGESASVVPAGAEDEIVGLLVRIVAGASDQQPAFPVLPGRATAWRCAPSRIA